MNEGLFSSLEALLVSSRPDDACIGLRHGSPVLWGDWKQEVAAWTATFSLRDEQTWALYHSDSLHFAAMLFGLWSAGKTVCLPGHTQPAFLEEVAKVSDAFVGEFPLEECLAAPLNEGASLADLKVFSQAELFIFTSGSSGTPKPIHKHIHQLSSEIFHLHEEWGVNIPSAFVQGTVSHQHIYGLLFRVLWPLCEGWCIQTQVCEYVEDLWNLQETSLPRLLISSPSHLSRLPLVINQAYADALRGVFSSGAPLATSFSLEAQRKFGAEVTEVFGSSETGGIAWRVQQADRDVGWTPIKGVEVQLDEASQCLKVRSSHLPEADEWYQTQDRAVVDDQHNFWLKGRADRIVKVEGKRVSLEEMEKHLLEQSMVVDVAVVELEGKGSRLGAVVVLSPEGVAMLNAQGKRKINQTLLSALLQKFERPTLPRKWRYVDRIPVNAQGKRLRPQLLECFV